MNCLVYAQTASNLKNRKPRDVLLERKKTGKHGHDNTHRALGVNSLGRYIVMHAASVTLQDLTLTYDRHPAVHHISGTFAHGSMTAIAGPNGAGKSTLLKAIAGLLAPSKGSITLENVGKGNIAYLPQASELNRDFPLTVLQMVAMGFWLETRGRKTITREHRHKALEAIASVGMSGFENRKIAKLSVGQFQRVMFARVLLQESPLVLLDEPFTAIDTATTEKLLNLVHNWHNEKRTIICVLHDFEQIREHFPDCMLMSRECVSWGKSKDTLNPNNLFKARMFREAWNEHAEVCKHA